MAQKKRSKRKHLSRDIKTKGYDYVLKTYPTLPQSFYTTHIKKMINQAKYDHNKNDLMIKVLEKQMLKEKTLFKLCDIYKELDQEYGYNIHSFWKTVQRTQKISEQFFIENFKVLDITRINTTINKWVKEENRSDDVRVLLMLNK